MIGSPISCLRPKRFLNGILGKAVDWAHGTKDLLAPFHVPGSGSGFRSAVMVGAGSNDPDFPG